MNYNNDVNLWRASKPAYKGKHVKIVNGHIVRLNEPLARYDNNEQAIQCLKDAGWVETALGWTPR